MKATEFKVLTQLEAREFDQFLNQYRLDRHIHQWPFISLEEAFNALEGHPKFRQSFSAFFDICLQDIALQSDLKVIQDETNREYRGGEIDGFFSLRIGRYIASSNTALRLRAIWDKLMGFRVLLNWPDKYEKFSGAKSKLKEFKKIANTWKIDGEKQTEAIDEWNKAWEESIDQLEKHVREIDDTFRTAEAHSVGRMGKWAFVKQEDEDDPFEQLLLASNDIYEQLNEVSVALQLYAVRKGEQIKEI
jgi:hypothetical protein